MDGRDRAARQAEHDLDAGFFEHRHEQIGTAPRADHWLGLWRRDGRRDRREHVGEIDRLLDHERRTGFLCGKRDLVVDQRAREHDDDVARLGGLLDPATRLDAIEAGHEEIEHHDIGSLRADAEKRFDRVRRNGELEIRISARSTPRRSQLELVIVDKQHPPPPATRR